MPRFFSTTGDRGQDRQWDDNEQRIARLESLQAAPAHSVAIQPVPSFSVASVLTVQESDGTNSQSCSVLQVDLAAGLAITNNEPVATITRTADTATPLANSGSGSAGTGNPAANNDHVHPQGGSRLLYADGSVPGGNTISNTTTETAFTSTFTIPANSLVAGQAIRMRWFGLYGTALVAPSLTAKLKFGSTVVLTTGAITTIGSLSNQGWSCDALLIVTGIGAGGAIEAQGYAEFATAATTSLSINLTNASAVSIDTTVSQAVTVTMTWSLASASDSITMRQMVATLETP